MKRFKHLQLLIFLLLTLNFSCSRDDNNRDEVTEEEALEIIQTSLVSEAYGLSIQAEDASSLDTEENLNTDTSCGVIKSLDFERNSISGAVINYSYTIDYDFSLICEGIQPVAFAIDFDSNGTYDAPRLSSNDRITYDAVLSNILNSQTAYVYNGSFLRDGTQVTRIAGRTKNFNSTLTIESVNVLIDKTSRMILGGSSSFSLSGTINTGDTFSYIGTVTYTGNGSAIVELNGNIYNVQI